jgi:XTP/dITP diphosphohydrolase
MLDEEERKARFESVIAYQTKNRKEMIFKGICRGTIAKKERGKRGFGYDPIFIPEGSDLTFAEMPIIEKNKFSHRGRAVMRLLKFLEIAGDEDSY